jgi:hypothetical protein
MAEAGVAGIDVGLWSGIFVPAATPPAIVPASKRCCKGRSGSRNSGIVVEAHSGVWG